VLAWSAVNQGIRQVRSKHSNGLEGFGGKVAWSGDSTCSDFFDGGVEGGAPRAVAGLGRWDPIPSGHKQPSWQVGIVAPLTAEGPAGRRGRDHPGGDDHLGAR
jgi:hypothetical protein